jgi:muramidase (phage lysozyme)
MEFEIMNTNRKAFLDMLAFSEGTKGIGDDGYNVIVGGSLFHDYSTHPNERIYIKKIDNYSTAAGRYQLLYKYYLAYSVQLRLNDFGHEAQDAIALQMIKECHALNDIDIGDFDAAVSKCASRWASLPGNNYGQRQNPIGSLRNQYVAFGGKLNTSHAA